MQNSMRIRVGDFRHKDKQLVDPPTARPPTTANRRVFVVFIDIVGVKVNGEWSNAG